MTNFDELTTVPDSPELAGVPLGAPADPASLHTVSSLVSDSAASRGEGGDRFFSYEFPQASRGWPPVFEPARRVRVSRLRALLGSPGFYECFCPELQACLVVHRDRLSEVEEVGG